MKTHSAFAIALVAIVSASSFADTVTMSSGRAIECVVLQENPDTIVVRRGYGTMTIPRDAIASVVKTPAITEATPSTSPAVGQRLPSWSEIVARLVKQSWAADLRQIPATVIDNGAMKNVPYQSYRCGSDYEVNIYGDPNAPSGIEIGMYRQLLHDPVAKENCIQFIVSVLIAPEDAEVLKTINRDKDLVARNGVTFEISPESEPDSYGGWWVSVYDLSELDRARASPEELKQITVASPRRSAATNLTSVLDNSPASGSNRLPSTASLYASDPDENNWTPSDLASGSSYNDSGRSAGGTVFVHAYTRRDGTYVGSYTREAPGFGMGRGHR